ncbi:MAG: hypothetical protein HY060_14485 [Proteobacteria bacterium]|nr:hypothetical protein [Pseudomonadota bacterium]
MVAVWLAAGFATMFGGLGLFVYEAGAWLSDGLWRPIALADVVRVPMTRSLFGLNALLESAFALPIGVDLIAVGTLALLVGRQVERWRTLKSGA